MHTIFKDSTDVVVGRRRRRKHSAEFKAQVVAACSMPGVSAAAMAMANVRIPVNVTGDSGIVTGVPANVTGEIPGT